MSPKLSKEGRQAERTTKVVSCRMDTLDINSMHLKRLMKPDLEIYIINLSDTGLQLNADQVFYTDSIFRARLSFNKGAEQVEAKFAVRWVRKNAFKSFGLYSYGLHFEEISDEDLEKLLQIYSRGEEKYTSKTSFL